MSSTDGSRLRTAAGRRCRLRSTLPGSVTLFLEGYKSDLLVVIKTILMTFQSSHQVILFRTLLLQFRQSTELFDDSFDVSKHSFPGIPRLQSVPDFTWQCVQVSALGLAAWLHLGLCLGNRKSSTTNLHSHLLKCRLRSTTHLHRRGRPSHRVATQREEQEATNSLDPNVTATPPRTGWRKQYADEDLDVQLEPAIADSESHVRMICEPNTIV